jgi:hypothetical protein
MNKPCRDCNYCTSYVPERNACWFYYQPGLIERFGIWLGILICDKAIEHGGLK